MIGNLMAGLVCVIIAVTLFGPVTEAVNEFQQEGEISGPSEIVLELVPAFFALGIMAMGVSIMVGALKSAGIMSEKRIIDLRSRAEKFADNLQPINPYANATNKSFIVAE